MGSIKTKVLSFIAAEGRTNVEDVDGPRKEAVGFSEQFGIHVDDVLSPDGVGVSGLRLVTEPRWHPQIQQARLNALRQEAYCSKWKVDLIQRQN